VKRRAVRKKVEVVATPILGPSVKGVAPTVTTLDQLPQDLVDLLPPLTPDARQALVDHMADVAMALLRDAGYIDVVRKD